MDKFSCKCVGNYRSPDDINNLKIKVVLRGLVDRSELEEIVFSEVFNWQEKKSGRHEMSKSSESDCNSIIFSYINEDKFVDFEEPFVDKRKMETSKLNTFTTNTNSENFDRLSKDFNDKLLIQRGIRNPFPDDSYEVMYIMAGMGEYVDDIWIKSEYVLCSLKYDKNRKLLTVFPDFTQQRPYLLEIEGETVRNYIYSIEDVSEKIPTDLFLKECDLQNKITSIQLEQRHKQIGDDFEMPPKNKLRVHFFFEICSAVDFENPEIFVQYFIDLPKQWTCDDTDALFGCTHTSRCNDDSAHFGHLLDFTLDCDLREINEIVILPAPYIYFEVISKASWARFRTEGLTYTSLPICQPGFYDRQLSCFRLLPNGILQKLRRSFIGDCSAFDDITWTGLPRQYSESSLNKLGVETISTGYLKVRMNVVHQSQALIDGGTGDCSRKLSKTFSIDKLRASALVKSVEQVVIAFKRAKRNMIEARQNV